MTDGPAPRAALERTVRLYPWYAACSSAYFWMPVFFLYFDSRVPARSVLWLESIYFASVVAMEVPSGYFSDRFGRRRTLVISATLLVAAYALFLAGAGFATLAAAQVCLAGGIAFRSGTDVSLHLDALSALGREDEFAPREARVARLGFVAAALAAVAGGASGLVDLRGAYVLSLVAALGALALAARFAEPHESRRAFGLLRHVGACVGRLRDAPLRWLFAFMVLMIVLNHLPYEFYQPYLRELDLLADGAPLAAGLHAGAAMLVAAAVADRSIAVRDRLGVVPTLLLATVGQVVMIALMAAVLHPLVAALVVLRSAPRALMTAPFNAEVAPRVRRELRATYLSLQSLTGRLGFAIALAALAPLGGDVETMTWAAMSPMLAVGAGLGLAGLLVLAATAGCLRRSNEAGPAPGA